VRTFKPGTPGLARRVGAVPRMIRATVQGRYDGRSRLTMMLVSAAYIVSPIDFVPEGILLFIGLVDDAAVAAWFAGALLDETERFLEWEKRQQAVPGHVVG
jgi:uncharacterized membrane protein YkvA (DUF1232 family)